ncbi:MAG: uracil-DNA glycosylase [Candidatus Omnitrophota bacterium]
MKPLNDELKEIVDALKAHIEMERLAGGEELLLARGAEDSPLEVLKEEVLSCKKCELCQRRRNVVFGAGDPKAKLMFVGEAPGMEEDLQGMPFVGRAGKLLTKIIESIGLKRKDVYIANVLKCRPPDNRNPLPTEILTCEEYLRKQIEIIEPAVICALGKFAAQTLLRSTETITKLRGRFYDFSGTKLIPTYHPAYLLRNPHDKRLVWEDMKKIRKILQKN